ncbi:MAG: glutamate--tRNA ligase [Aggregatilineales bacterium]
MSENVTRTRFGPSPTGPLHIGGVRTALFSWLLAKHGNGQFILRIEDTDQSRFVEGSIEEIKAMLEWLGITPDEGPGYGGEHGPYTQSERLDSYHEWVGWLLDNDKAYRCFCTSERLKRVNEEKRARKEPSGYDRHCRNLSADDVQAKLDAGESHVVRFKMPADGVTVTQDLLRGAVEFDNTTLQDSVILKSDGFPTYHLAHVVDDHLMEISHVTRANEWLASLPLHWNMWEAFGWEKPVYVHLPVLLNPNGKGKLSKRTEAFSASGEKILVLAKEYKAAGYLPEAILNFMTNIGWNFGDNEEIFDIKEAIERFEIADVNQSNSAFPIDKLDWLNGMYIREMPAEDLAKRLRPVLEDAGLEVNVDTLLKVTPIAQTRIKTLNDIVDLAGFFFHDPADFEAPAADLLIQKKMDAAGTVNVLEAATKTLESLDNLEHSHQYEIFKALAKEIGVKNGQLFGAMRVAVTGQKISTPTFETIEILGKAESLRRFQLAIEKLNES